MSSLKYITLNALMASVEGDLHSFADNAMIDRGKVIKVIRRVNEDLGLKIYKEKSEMIEVRDYRSGIPVDLLFVQGAWLCTESHYHESGEIMGTHTEQIYCPTGVSLMCDGKICGDIPGVDYYIQQTFKDKIVKYKGFEKLNITGNMLVNDSIKPINSSNCKHVLFVHDNHDISANFKEGKVYINYLADMIDEDGNLLLLDHPLVRDYYEYAVKKYLIEMWLINNDADVTEKWKLVKAELYESRLRALNFINTVEYSQIKGSYEANRNRFYNRHMKIFS